MKVKNTSIIRATIKPVRMINFFKIDNLAMFLDSKLQIFLIILIHKILIQAKDKIKNKVTKIFVYNPQDLV